MVHFLLPSNVGFSSRTQSETLVGPVAEVEVCGRSTVVSAPLATELLPLVTYLVVAGSLLDDDELVFVEPWWPAALEHMGKDLVALYVEKFRYCSNMQVLTAIIDDFEVVVVEEVATDGILHNVDIVHAFGWDHTGVVKLYSCFDFA